MGDKLTHSLTTLSPTYRVPIEYAYTSNLQTYIHTTQMHTHFKSNLPINVSLVRPASKGSMRYLAASTVARTAPSCSATG